MIGDAGFMVSPDDRDDLVSKMIQMASESGVRQNLKEHGYLQASKFDWTTSADSLHGLYQEALDTPKRNHP